MLLLYLSITLFSSCSISLSLYVSLVILLSLVLDSSKRKRSSIEQSSMFKIALSHHMAAG